MPDLTNAVLAGWAQIPTDAQQNLTESLPRRVEAVTATKGEPTAYECPWNGISDKLI